MRIISLPFLDVNELMCGAVCGGFCLFVKYAFCCTKLQRPDEASEVLGHVMLAPVFRQSAPMQQVLRLAYAGELLTSTL